LEDVRVAFELESVTPLFIAGADQRSVEGEGLRAPSLRGVLRWWFRALKATDNLRELLREEEKVFGSSLVKSRVTVRSGVKGRLKVSERMGLNVGFDEVNRRVTGEDSGVAYLLMVTAGGVVDAGRPFIEPGSRFTVDLSCDDKDVLRKVLACFWCAVYLGNFGARARRGAGGLTISPRGGAPDYASSLTGLDFTLNKDGSRRVVDWVVENVEKAVRIVNDGEKPRGFSTRYSNLCLSRIIVSGKAWSSWKDALNDIGKRYERYRFEHRGNYLDMAVFGLPVSHGKVTVFGRDEGGRRVDRRSSPLIFKVFRSGGSYYWGLIRLSGEFLPEGWVVTDGRVTQKPDYTAIDGFWGEVRRAGCERVLLTPLVLDEIVERVRREVNPRRIVLFGSRARGDAHRGADIDLAVDSEKPVMREDIPVDIVWLRRTSKDVEELMEREGVVIYEREG